MSSQHSTLLRTMKKALIGDRHLLKPSLSLKKSFLIQSTLKLLPMNHITPQPTQMLAESPFQKLSTFCHLTSCSHIIIHYKMKDKNVSLEKAQERDRFLHRKIGDSADSYPCVVLKRNNRDNVFKGETRFKMQLQSFQGHTDHYRIVQISLLVPWSICLWGWGMFSN